MDAALLAHPPGPGYGRPFTPEVGVLVRNTGHMEGHQHESRRSPRAKDIPG